MHLWSTSWPSLTREFVGWPLGGMSGIDPRTGHGRMPIGAGLAGHWRTLDASCCYSQSRSWSSSAWGRLYLLQAWRKILVWGCGHEWSLTTTLSYTAPVTCAHSLASPPAHPGISRTSAPTMPRLRTRRIGTAARPRLAFLWIVETFWWLASRGHQSLWPGCREGSDSWAFRGLCRSYWAWADQWLSICYRRIYPVSFAFAWGWWQNSSRLQIWPGPFEPSNQPLAPVQLLDVA